MSALALFAKIRIFWRHLTGDLDQLQSKTLLYASTNSVVGG